MKCHRLLRLLLAVSIIAAILFMGLSYQYTSANIIDRQDLQLLPIQEPVKGNPKLESILNQLLDAGKTKGPAAITAFAEQRAVDLVDNRVRVVIETMPGDSEAACEAAIALGADVEASYENLIRVTIPVSVLIELANNPSVRFIRQPLKMEPQDIISEGVSLINADDFHSAGYTGSGVKVGILDTGFYGYSSLLGT